MTFIDKLTNISTFELNETITNDSANIVGAVVDNANDMTGGLWFIFGIWALFIFFFVIFLKRDEEYRLDMPRALMLSSLICLVISIISVITPLSNSFMPVIWFTCLFLVGLIGSYERKKKNL